MQINYLIMVMSENRYNIQHYEKDSVTILRHSIWVSCDSAVTSLSAALRVTFVWNFQYQNCLEQETLAILVNG